MKKLFAFTLLSVLFCFGEKLYAQTEENRIKVQLTISYGGKNIVTDLNSVSTSITRSYDDMAVIPAAKDTGKNASSYYKYGAFYLSIDAKKISDELLRVFSKKQTRFDGTITMVDTYGKNPTRTIKFKQASLYTYSDQFSGASYSDNYGSTAISLTCKEISINGIVIEQ